MTHHVRECRSQRAGSSIGRASANQVLQLDLVLPLRDPAGLKSFLSDVYNPSSPKYRHFLTLAEFTQRLAPHRRITMPCFVSQKPTGLK